MKCSAKPAEKPKVTYSISGVVENVDGAPLPGATVNFLGETAEPSPTGQDGVYAFKNLDARTTGGVTVTFGQRSFEPAKQTICVTPE